MRPCLLRLGNSIASSTRLAARKALEQTQNSLPFSVISTCPPATCGCSETPPDLDIERSKDLNGTMAPHSQHVLISSGQTDWTSKIEDERDVRGWGQFTAGFKAAVGPGGRFHDPYNTLMISTSSFNNVPREETSSSHAESSHASILLLPSFKYIQSNGVTKSDIDQFTQAYILPEEIHSSYDALPKAERIRMTRSAASPSHPEATTVQSPIILICSHKSRDTRCGVLGPLLRDEFSRYLTMKNFSVTKDQLSNTDAVSLGLVSHVGGHKWAGNVIIYIPQDWPKALQSPHSEKASHPLGGTGIWYGRVEPKHVQGIVEETLLKGNVIRELFRGGLNHDGNIIRL